MVSVYHPVRVGAIGVEAVKRHYEDRGYEVSTVTQGADLRVKAPNGRVKLVEVKTTTQNRLPCQIANSVSSNQRNTCNEVAHVNLSSGVISFFKLSGHWLFDNFKLKLNRTALMG